MMTPLLAVIERGYLDIMRLLLDLGADRTLCDRHVCFPYSYYMCNLILLFLIFERRIVVLSIILSSEEMLILYEIFCLMPIKIFLIRCG